MNQISVNWQPFEGDPGVMNSITFARRRFARALAHELREIASRIVGNDGEGTAVEIKQYEGHWPISAIVSVSPAGLTEAQIEAFDRTLQELLGLDEFVTMRQAAQLMGENDVSIRHCAPLRTA